MFVLFFFAFAPTRWTRPESDQLDKNTVERADIDTELDDDYYYDDDDVYIPVEATTFTTTTTTTTKTTKPPSTSEPTAQKTTPRTPTTSTSTSPTLSKTRNLTIARNVPRRPQTDEDVPLIDRIDSVSLLPKDNDIADAANTKNSDSPDVNLPRNKVESGQDSPKLNLGISFEHLFLL